MSNTDMTQKGSCEEISSYDKESVDLTKLTFSCDKEPQDRRKLTLSNEKVSQVRRNLEDKEKQNYKSLQRLLILWRRTMVLIVTPLIFSPLVISRKKELRCAFCVCLVGVYWMTEVLPLAVTAMFPVFLFPVTCVMTCEAVAQQFSSDTIILFIGGLIVAVAIEKCYLHKRIALFVLKMVGSDPKFIMLGLMLSTASLSMFISNTATTAMMVPLVQSLVNELVSCYSADPEFHDENERRCKRMSVGLVLCICIASSIGGTGTITGTATNLVLAGQLPELFGSEAAMDYLTWFIFAFPLMCVCLAAAWCTLTVFFLRNAPPKDKHITELLQNKYNDLPRPSFAEKSVALCFVVLLLLWIFRDPGLFTGFGVLFSKKYYTDTTSAIMVAVLLFALPNERPNLCHCTKNHSKEISRLMDWSTMQKRFPWDVVLLLGSGFALAAGVKESGLTLMIGGLLSTSDYFPLWALQLMTMVITLGVTNFCSNVATTTIFLPIAATFASKLEVHPLNLVLPVTITASFAFVLPVGTPPNAIVFSTGMVTVADMAKSGTVLSFVCLVMTLIYMNTVAPVLLSLSEFPTWAQFQNSSGAM